MVSLILGNNIVALFEHMAVPPAPDDAGITRVPPPSRHIKAELFICFIVTRALVSLALYLELFKLVTTILESTLIIAITTSNSIKVNPFFIIRL